MLNAGENECSATPCNNWYPKKSRHTIEFGEAICKIDRDCHRLIEKGGYYSRTSCTGPICRYSCKFYNPKLGITELYYNF